MPYIRRNWAELSVLEERIGRVKDILSRGSIYISEFGIFGAKSDEYFPAGFNAWRESDGKLAIGEFRESDHIPVAGTDQEMRGIDAPPGFWKCRDPQGREEHIKRNFRGILQLFQVKVFIFPDRIEIKGAIPTQLIEFPKDRRKNIAPIISSPSPAINIYEFLPMFPAGEGFTLKVLPEGTGVRLSHTNQVQTEPSRGYQKIESDMVSPLLGEGLGGK